MKRGVYYAKMMVDLVISATRFLGVDQPKASHFGSHLESFAGNDGDLSIKGYRILNLEASWVAFLSKIHRLGGC